MSDALNDAQAAHAPPGYVMDPWQRGFGRTVGPFYRRQDAGGGCTIGFRVEEHHANGLNNCHGGMLVSLADMAWGHVGEKPEGWGWVTVRLVTDFLSGAKMGEWVEAASELIARDGDLYTTRGQLWCGDRTIMTGTGVFKMIEMDPAIHARMRG
ncbi:MAG: thioesterase [Phenylobacterium sp.]|jgi:acyl-coenzyme A thioesterase PaaI-like protein|nr:thioesterase [Phenylobacterium sp.]